MVILGPLILGPPLALVSSHNGKLLKGAKRHKWSRQQQGGVGWGEQSPGLRDSEGGLSGEGCEECLDAVGRGVDLRGIPQRWRVSLSVSNEINLPVSDAVMVREGVPERGWVRESHISEDGVEVGKKE